MNPPSSTHCAETRELLPELALGIADGEDRAAALEHISGCAGCRRQLEELSFVADDLVALAPRREPPAGFEARVVDRLELSRTPAPRAGRPRLRRTRLRRFGFAAAVVAAAAATAIAMNVSYSSDRHLASQYRAALQGAHGKYFQSAPLTTRQGEQVGIVFGYQGSPSWLFYVLRGPYRTGLYREQIVSRSGRSISLPPFRLVAASWGVATPIPLRDVALVRLIRQPDGSSLEAPLPVVDR
jgi:Putative zinc-finger